MSGNHFSKIGGARLGAVNATWPFARLCVSPDRLELKVLILGRYAFAPDQVVSIERYGVIPILGWGIRIHHNNPDYPEKIVFWCQDSPDMLIRRIEQTGFLPAADSAIQPSAQKREFPVKWQAIALIALIWNLLFLLDENFRNLWKMLFVQLQIHGGPGPVTPPDFMPIPGPFPWLAVLMIFIGSLLVRRPGWLQKCIMKPGRSVEEIRPFLRLLTLVSGVMTVVLPFSWLAKPH